MGPSIYSYRQFHANIADKLTKAEFLDDVDDLARDLHGYEPRAAAELLMERLGMRLRNAPAEIPTLHFRGDS